uniref:Uncharacterized protein n=1 Tax=Rhizophora mucronata TaxID=61149 RepID=A0A2P2Q264_RHIMU
MFVCLCVTPKEWYQSHRFYSSLLIF